MAGAVRRLIFTNQTLNISVRRSGELNAWMEFKGCWTAPQSAPP